MTRCKKGDMAIVTGARIYNGIVVECLEEMAPGTDRILPQYGQLWLTDHKFTYTSLGRGAAVISSCFPDDLLRPLPKLREEDERDVSKTKELEKV